MTLSLPAPRPSGLPICASLAVIEGHEHQEPASHLGRSHHGSADTRSGCPGSCAKGNPGCRRAEAEAWSLRMEGYGGPAQPSPTIRQCCTGTGLSSSRFEQTVNAFHDSMHPRPASPTPAPSKAGSAIVQPKGGKFGRRPLSSGVQNCTPKHSSQHSSENTRLLH